MSDWKKVALTGANAVFSAVMPNSAYITATSNDAIKMAKQSIRNFSSKSDREASTINKSSSNIFDSALRDMEDGNYSVNRINDEMFDDFDSISNNFSAVDTENASRTPEQIIADSNKGVAQSVIQASSAQLRGYEAFTKSLIKSNVKSSKASTQVLQKTLFFGFETINSQLATTNARLASIDRSLKTIVEFNNRNTVEYYNKSLSMMNSIGTMMNNLDESMNGKEYRKKGFINNGLFDISEYAKFAKDGVMEVLFGKGATKSGGRSTDRYKYRSDVSGSNSGIMGMVVNMMVNKFLPKGIADPLKDFDKNINRFADGFLKVLGKSDLLKAFGLDTVLGRKTSRIDKMNLGNYTKGAMQWNGMAQKALVEVIPELLTSIDSKLDNSEKRYYDYETGKFKTRSKVEKDFQDTYFKTIDANLKDILKDLENITANKTNLRGSNQDKFIKEIKDLIELQISDGKDPKKVRDDIYNKMADQGISDKVFKDFHMKLTESIENAIESVNENLTKVGSTNSVYRNIHNNSSRGSSGINKVKGLQKRGGNLGNYQNDKTIKNIITKVLRANGYNDTKLANDINLINEVNYMLMSGEDEDLIESAIIKRQAKLNVNKKFKNSKFGRGKLANSFIGSTLYGLTGFDEGIVEDYGIAMGPNMSNSLYRPKIKKTKSGSGFFGRKADQMSNSIYDAQYGKPTRYTNSSSVRATVRAATSSASNRTDNSVTRASDDAFKSVNRTVGKIMNSTGTDIERQQAIISKGIQVMEKSKPATTVETSIIESNNATKLAMSSLASNVQGLSTSLVGKDGVLSNMVKDKSKEFAENAKEKLLTNDDAVFKKQYDESKQFLKDTKTGTGKEIKKGYGFIYDNTMKYLFGNDYQNDKAYSSSKILSSWLNPNKVKDDGVVGAVSGEIAEAGGKASEAITDSTSALVGDTNKDPKSKEKDYKKTFLSQLKKTTPKVLAGGLAGLTIGALNSSFSVLGSMFLPGGPVAGAIVGSGLAILSQTDAFKTFMFGKEDKDSGERKGGIINKKLREKFKKALPLLVGGAVLGGLKSVFTGALGMGGMGVLGSALLPGGILGGALVGVGFSMLKNSDSFKAMLFGKKNKDGEIEKPTLLAKSINAGKAKMGKLFPVLGKGLAGLGVGALTGAVLGNMGYLPAMLSMGGPIGMGIAGLSLGLLSSSKKFDTFMFGSKNEDGSRNKDGLMNRAINMINVNMIEPITDSFKKNVSNLIDWGRDKITLPFRIAFEPLIHALGGLKDNISDMVKTSMNKLTKGVMDLFVGATKKIFSPITKIVSFVGKGALNITSLLAKTSLMPLTFLAQGAQMLTSGRRRKDMKNYNKSYRANRERLLQEQWALEESQGKKKNFLQKASDRASAMMGHGTVADKYRQEYDDMLVADGGMALFNTEGRKAKEQLKIDRKARLEDERKWKRINKARTNISTKLGYVESNLSDADYEKYKKQLVKSGVDGNFINSQKDIFELLYNRNSFKNRMNGINEAENEEESLISPVEQREWQKDVLHELQELNKTQNAALRVDAGGEVSIDDLKKAKKGSKVLSDAQTSTEDFTNSVAKGMDIFNTKKEEEDEEEAETEEARSLGDKLFGPVKNVINTGKGKMSNMAQAVSDGMSNFMDSKFGSALLTIGKYALGALGITAATGVVAYGYDKINEKYPNLFNDVQTYMKTKLEETVDFISEEAIPFTTNMITSSIEKAPILFENIGNWVTNNSDKVVDFAKSIIENVASPILVALASGLPEILSTIWNSGKSIVGAGWDAFMGNSKDNLTDNEANSLRASGTNVTSVTIQGTKSDTPAEALAIAQEKGYTNASVEMTSDGKYIAKTQTALGSNIVLDEYGNEKRVNTSNSILDVFGEGASRGILGNIMSGSSGSFANKVFSNMGSGVSALGKGVSWLGSKMSKRKNKIVKGIGGLTNLTGKITTAVGDTTKHGSSLIDWATDLFNKKKPELSSNIIDTQSATFTKYANKMIDLLKDLSNNKTLQKAMSKLDIDDTTKAINDIVEFLTKNLDTVVKKTGTEVSKGFMNKLLDLAVKTLAKVGIKTGAAALTAFTSEAIFAAIGGIYGGFSTANLFGVREEDADAGMIGTSIVLEALLGTSIGGIVDFIFAAVELVTGYDAKQGLVELIYSTILGQPMSNIEESREQLDKEREFYNKMNSTNLDMAAYNDEVNKDAIGKAWDWLSDLNKENNHILKAWNLMMGNEEVETYDYDEVYRNLTAKGYSDSQLSNMSKDQIDSLYASLGYGGRGKSSSSQYAQNNPKWANQPIGLLPNGSVATMGNAGCGPTAMSIVANKFGASLGSGVSPGDMGKYASSNGYISEGGANAGLFTHGASQMGLNSESITNRGQLVSNLSRGKPTILTGKSNGGNDPFTSVGHIVVADGINGNNVNVIDPNTGKRGSYNINSLGKGIEHGWSYSTGYGIWDTIKGSINAALLGPISSTAYNVNKLFGSKDEDEPTVNPLSTATGSSSNVSSYTTNVASTATKPTTSSSSSSNTNKTTEEIIASLPTSPGNKEMLLAGVVEQDKPISTTSASNGGIIDQAVSGVKTLASTSKSIFSKIGDVVNIMQAQVNAILNGTSFAEEYDKIKSSSSDSGDSGSDSSSGSSSNSTSNYLYTGEKSDFLNSLISNPMNLGEELLGKTSQLIYQYESNGDYTTVSPEDGKNFSVGAFQAQGAIAARLLSALAGASTASTKAKAVFNKYATKANNGGTLTVEEATELKAALSEPAFQDELRYITDREAVKTFRNYHRSTAPWFDSGLIKNPKSLTMLSDIGNIDSAHITGAGSWYDTSFNKAWSNKTNRPDRAGELDSVRNTLKGNDLYYANKQYTQGWYNRIDNAHNVMDAYNLKHYDPESTMVNEFYRPIKTEHDPLGFGEGVLSGLSGIQGISTVTDTIGKMFGDMLGIDLGFSSSSSGIPDSEDTSNDGSSSSSGSYSGSSVTDTTPKNSNYPSTSSSPNGNTVQQWFTKTISGSRMSSNYGMRQYGNTAPHMHTGIDFAAPSGTPIYSPVSGVCIRNEFNSAYGNLLVLLAADGTQHFFAHMVSRSDIPVNETIAAGQLIGYVGTTGNSTGNHLHYEIRNSPYQYPNNAIDPNNYSFPIVQSSSLGYGNGYVANANNKSKHKNLKNMVNMNDSKYKRISKTTLSNIPAYPKDAKSSKHIGIGGDLGTNMVPTEDRLDRIIAIMTQWMSESNSNSANNVNMVTSNTTVNNQTTKTEAAVNPSSNKNKVLTNHTTLSSRGVIR